MIRLDKFLCETLGVTRREATLLLKNKRITVQGETVKSGALKIEENADVTHDGKTLHLSGPRYYMMNKASGYVCSQEDASNPTVFVLIDEVSVEKLHIAGRLDADTTGLLLITDDGQWSHKVTSPKHKCAKTYRVELASPVSEETTSLFEQGVQLRNETQATLPAHMQIIDETHLLLTIHEGKYHQVKRMFAAVGNRVVCLHRESVGELVLDPSLLPGEYRPLTQEEVALFSPKK